MSKRYFSSESAHGSSSSHGFANDTVVMAFNSKKARDEYVENSRNLSCTSIPFARATKEATNYNLTQNRTNAPRPFSCEFWGIVNSGCVKLPAGCIGTVECCADDDYDLVERLYK